MGRNSESKADWRLHRMSKRWHTNIQTDELAVIYSCDGQTPLAKLRSVTNKREKLPVPRPGVSSTMSMSQGASFESSQSFQSLQRRPIS